LIATRGAETILIDGVEYLTAEDAASVLGVKPATLYAYASRGRLRSWRQGIRRRSLYRVEDLEKLMRLEPSAEREVRIPLAEEWVPYTG
jgi:citrate synthase